jgi:hypothetical protein
MVREMKDVIWHIQTLPSEAARPIYWAMTTSFHIFTYSTFMMIFHLTLYNLQNLMHCELFIAAHEQCAKNVIFYVLL